MKPSEMGGEGKNVPNVMLKVMPKVMLLPKVMPEVMFFPKWSFSNNSTIVALHIFLTRKLVSQVVVELVDVHMQVEQHILDLLNGVLH